MPLTASDQVSLIALISHLTFLICDIIFFALFLACPTDQGSNCIFVTVTMAFIK